MFRSYDPTVGRWLQVDPLAELAPGWTPYRNAFNNPISYVDPFGLFESRREARRFRRANGLRGRIKRTSKDKDGNKTFAFTDKGSGTEYTFGAGSAGNFSGDAAFPTTEVILGGETMKVRLPKLGTVSSWEPNDFAKFRDYNFATSAVYGIANDASLTIQAFNPLQTNVRHLSGMYASQPETEMAFVNTAATAVPIGRGTQAVKSLAPTGLTIASRLNAAQFSSTFKGTIIARAHPKIRGYLNRTLNFGIDKSNNTLQTGNAAFSGAKQAKGLSPTQNE